jgi:hypothetical protein
MLDVLAGAWPMSAVFSTTLFHCVAQRNSEGRGLAFSVEGDPVWLHCDSASVTDLLDRHRQPAWLWTLRGERLPGQSPRWPRTAMAFLDLLYEGEAVELRKL